MGLDTYGFVISRSPDGSRRFCGVFFANEAAEKYMRILFRINIAISQR
jgi:hypothetical protein